MMKERNGPLPALLLGGLVLFAMVGYRFDPGNQRVVAGTEQANEEPTATTTSGPQKGSASTYVANPFCRACHANFNEEKLTCTHERAGIGCERCHGESIRHGEDEANVTPPEMMYPEARINPTCMMCHPRHEIDHVKEHQPILQANASIFEESPSEENGKNHCTDCHGEGHRMPRRTVRWNKATGELIR